MKAVICTQYGSPEVLKLAEVAKPEPKNDEILVKIRATAVNSGDVRVRGLVVEGFMRIVMRVVLGFAKPRKPILGTVLAGVVEKIGANVRTFKVGDEVFAGTAFNFGTYAEYASLKENSAVSLKPTTASFEEAASLVFGGNTALHFLHKAQIRTKKEVLIYGATGSVGVAAVQIANYYQANVTAVCSEKGAELVKNLGANEVILYTQQDFTKLGKKYDIVFDAVGKVNKKKVAPVLSAGGHFITVAGLEVAKETAENLQFLKELFDNQKLRAVIDKTYHLSDIVEAHKYVDSGRKKGDVVIRIN